MDTPLKTTVESLMQTKRSGLGGNLASLTSPLRRVVMQSTLFRHQQRSRFLFIVLVVILLLCLINIAKPPQDLVLCNDAPSLSYREFLRKYAFNGSIIILALVDKAFVDMAFNLYYSSLRRHNINNFLFVGAGEGVCELLSSRSLPCFHYTNDQDSDKASRYLSKAFLRKMNIRTEMILEALEEGFTVLHTDLDVYFFKDPLPELKKLLVSADIVALQDTTVHNAGFLVVKPTRGGIDVYRHMKNITDASPTTDDQQALNSAIQIVANDYEEFRVAKLDPKRYMCGLTYFESGGRMFAEDRDCPDCVVVHNNWIVSREAKTYRFKELHMWTYDKQNYYKSTSQHYLVYDNPVNDWASDAMATDAELKALRAALAIGKMTGRIVILPRFHCGRTHLEGTGISLQGRTPRRVLYDENRTSDISAKPLSQSSGNARTNDTIRYIKTENRSVPYARRFRECSLNALLDMISFDEEFGDSYRESSFLTHPLVHIPSSQYSNIQLVITRVAREALNKLISRGRLDSSKYNSSENSKESDSSVAEYFEIFWPPSSQEEASSSVTEQNIIDRYSIASQNIHGTSIKRSPRVLVFHSLYNLTPIFTNTTIGEEFDSKIKRAFKRRAYRQYYQQ